MLKRISGVMVIALCVLFLATKICAAPLDFSTFTAEDGVTLVGDQILFSELDTDEAAFYFFNDNFLVDPLAASLTFNYKLEIGPKNKDYLVVVFDFNDYKFEVGGLNELEESKWILSGYASIDLIPYQGDTISLAFGFEASDLFTDSTGYFSNINIVPVPEPATLLLLGAGLAGLVVAKRKKFRNRK